MRHHFLSRCAARPGIAFILLLPLSVLAADPPTTYAAIHVGGNNLDRWPAAVSFGGPVARGQLALDGGANAGVAAGRAWGQNRLEIEYQRGQVRLSGAGLGPVSGSATGSGHYSVLTLGAYRVFPLGDRFGAVAGAAAGIASVSLPQAGFTGCSCFARASSAGWTAQIRTGLELDVGSGVTAFAHYSRISLPGPDGSGTPSITYDRRGVSVASLGLRKSF